jgi:hypothetical protein
MSLKQARSAVKDATNTMWNSGLYHNIEVEHDVFTLQDRYKRAKRRLPRGLSRLWYMFRARYL